MVGVHYILPVVAAIVALLIIVYFSYCQTIEAYPHGGGSYTVASANLGHRPGLLAAAALMIDYVLTAAVGITAGVGALVSALPSLVPHRLGICLLILLILMLVNMRGVRDTGVAFLIPSLILLMAMVKRHYDGVETQTADDTPLDMTGFAPPFVIVPLDRWNRITEKGMRFALGLSRDVQAVHVDCGEHDEKLDEIWQRNVVAPVRAAGAHTRHLVVARTASSSCRW